MYKAQKTFLFIVLLNRFMFIQGSDELAKPETKLTNIVTNIAILPLSKISNNVQSVNNEINELPSKTFRIKLKTMLADQAINAVKGSLQNNQNDIRDLSAFQKKYYLRISAFSFVGLSYLAERSANEYLNNTITIVHNYNDIISN